MKLRKLNTKEEILKEREGTKVIIFNGQFKFILTLCLILEQMLHINIKSNTILYISKFCILIVKISRVFYAELSVGR